MLPHQERVAIEEKELSEKYMKLSEFIRTDDFNRLDPAERNLLSRQLIVMG